MVKKLVKLTSEKVKMENEVVDRLLRLYDFEIFMQTIEKLKAEIAKIEETLENFKNFKILKIQL